MTLGTGSDCGLRYIMKSRFLAIGGLILLINVLLCTAAAILPFWFQFSVMYRYGEETRTRIYVQSWGLFTMGETDFSSVVQMEKVLSGPTLPGYVRVGQILYLLGACTTAVCAGTAVVLSLYRYGVFAAEMALSCVTTAAAVCLVIGVLMAFLLTEKDLSADDWNQFPLQEDLVVPKAYPFIIEIDWAFGIACVSAILEIVTAVLFWLHACISCRGIERIRYQQVNGPNKYKPIPEPNVRLRIPPPVAAPPTLYQPSYPTRGYDPTMAVGHEGLVITGDVSARVEPYYRSEPLSTNYSQTYHHAPASISEEITI